MDKRNMKIAFVTDDGTSISAHFGRAKFYEVIHIENGSIVNRERRDKTGHHTFAHNEDHEHHHGNEQHGFDDASRLKHESMAASITDCQVVVARGMGNGAYQHLTSANLIPIITDIADIDTAVKGIIDGTVVNHTEKLH